MNSKSAIQLGAHDVLAMFDGTVGAYVHVPFCEWICPFCPYNKVRAEVGLAERYFAALHAEIDMYLRARGELGTGSFTSLYIGGGTPTLYPDALAEVIARLSVVGEVAIEVLPSHGTPERLDQLAAIGVSAASIGAQSFNDEVLRRLHRPHDAATALNAVQNALSRFDCVDVDLIMDASLEHDVDLQRAFLDDLRRCFSLGVDQVSTYPLMRFGYTPFGIAHHNRRHEHRVLKDASEIARAMGYERRSVWTFNKLGARNYSSITRRRFLGMGAGSASFAGRDFLVNHFGVGRYVEALGNGRLPLARWLNLGAWGGAAYDLFWQAYTGCVSLDGMAETFGKNPARFTSASLRASVAAGFMQTEGTRFQLTARGYNLYHDMERFVTYQFIEPLWAEMLSEHNGTNADWAFPHEGRSGKLWHLARQHFERKLIVRGNVGG